MKLSDIFSLNLNSKGGAKLFKKIVNKYNLDYKQVRKSVEENTNKSGDSSSDMEYYSTSLEKIQTLGLAGDTIMGTIPLIKWSYQQSSLDEMKLISGGGIFYTFMSNNLNTLKLYGIGFTKIKQNNDEYNSFKDYFSRIISETGGDPNIFDTVFTPITKEEFYNLNNV